MSAEFQGDHELGASECVPLHEGHSLRPGPNLFILSSCAFTQTLCLLSAV